MYSSEADSAKRIICLVFKQMGRFHKAHLNIQLGFTFCKLSLGYFPGRKVGVKLTQIMVESFFCGITRIRAF